MPDGSQFTPDDLAVISPSPDASWLLMKHIAEAGSRHVQSAEGSDKTTWQGQHTIYAKWIGYFTALKTDIDAYLDGEKNADKETDSLKKLEKRLVDRFKDVGFGGKQVIGKYEEINLKKIIGKLHKINTQRNRFAEIHQQNLIAIANIISLRKKELLPAPVQAARTGFFSRRSAPIPSMRKDPEAAAIDVAPQVKIEPELMGFDEPEAVLPLPEEKPVVVGPNAWQKIQSEIAKQKNSFGPSKTLKIAPAGRQAILSTQAHLTALSGYVGEKAAAIAATNENDRLIAQLQLADDSYNGIQTIRAAYKQELAALPRQQRDRLNKKFANSLDHLSGVISGERKQFVSKGRSVAYAMERASYEDALTLLNDLPELKASDDAKGKLLGAYAELFTPYKAEMEKKLASMQAQNPPRGYNVKDSINFWSQQSRERLETLYRDVPLDADYVTTTKLGLAFDKLSSRAKKNADQLAPFGDVLPVSAPKKSKLAAKVSGLRTISAKAGNALSTGAAHVILHAGKGSVAARKVTGVASNIVRGFRAAAATVCNEVHLAFTTDPRRTLNKIGRGIRNNKWELAIGTLGGATKFGLKMAFGCAAATTCWPVAVAALGISVAVTAGTRVALDRYHAHEDYRHKLEEVAKTGIYNAEELRAGPVWNWRQSLKAGATAGVLGFAFGSAISYGIGTIVDHMSSHVANSVAPLGNHKPDISASSDAQASAKLVPGGAINLHPATAPHTSSVTPIPVPTPAPATDMQGVLNGMHDKFPGLVDQAQSALKTGNTDRALWRIADVVKNLNDHGFHAAAKTVNDAATDWIQQNNLSGKPESVLLNNQAWLSRLAERTARSAHHLRYQ